MSRRKTVVKIMTGLASGLASQWLMSPTYASGAVYYEASGSSIDAINTTASGTTTPTSYLNLTSLGYSGYTVAGFTFGTDNTLYIAANATTGSDAIIKYNPVTHAASTLAALSTGTYNYEAAHALRQVVVDSPTGNVYVTDQNGSGSGLTGGIIKITAAGTVSNYYHDVGNTLALASSGTNLYLGDAGSISGGGKGSVYKIPLSTGVPAAFVNQFYGGGSAYVVPNAFSYDPYSTSLYDINYGGTAGIGNDIFKISSAGGLTGYGATGDPNMNALGLGAGDGSGNIYVGLTNGAVKKYTAANTSTTLVNSGGVASPGYGNIGGPILNLTSTEVYTDIGGGNKIVTAGSNHFYKDTQFYQGATVWQASISITGAVPSDGLTPVKVLIELDKTATSGNISTELSQIATYSGVTLDTSSSQFTGLTTAYGFVPADSVLLTFSGNPFTGSPASESFNFSLLGGTAGIDGIVVVPEPATAALSVGAFMLFARRRRSRV